jgi:hypothetical protein
VYVLVAIGILVLLGTGAVAGRGFFLVHKAKQAGLDPALWERNPELAAAKLLMAVNPDTEVVSVDEKGGKIVKMNFADLKQGKITFEGEDEEITIGSSGLAEPSWPAFSSPSDRCKRSDRQSPKCRGWSVQLQDHRSPRYSSSVLRVRVEDGRLRRLPGNGDRWHDGFLVRGMATGQ